MSTNDRPARWQMEPCLVPAQSVLRFVALKTQQSSSTQRMPMPCPRHHIQLRKWTNGNVMHISTAAQVRSIRHAVLRTPCNINLQALNEQLLLSLLGLQILHGCFLLCQLVPWGSLLYNSRGLGPDWGGGRRGIPAGRHLRWLTQQMR